MPEEMTLEQEIDRIFATLGNAEIETGAGARPIVAARTPEPEEQEPVADGDADDWDQD
jgi:hypothetical protein